jgi:hypothetical protein
MDRAMLANLVNQAYYAVFMAIRRRVSVSPTWLIGGGLGHNLTTVACIQISYPWHTHGKVKKFPKMWQIVDFGVCLHTWGLRLMIGWWHICVFYQRN